MPTSEKVDKLPRKAHDFFYRDRGLRADQLLHDSILEDGDHDAAERVSREVGKQLGLTDEQNDLLVHGSKRDKRVRHKSGFDPSQPRDWHGRWEGGGGDEHDSPSEPPPKAASLLDPKPVSVDEVIKSVPDAPALLEKAYAKAEKETHTDALVSEGGHRLERDRPSYAPSRRALHENIIRGMFTPEAIKAATPSPGEKPTFTMLGGRGGSGKSWFMKSGVVDQSKAVYINNDEIKDQIPEFKGYNAAAVHEESSHITDMAEAVARARGLSVILDATMKTPGSTAKKIQAYKDAGYRLEGHYMYASPKTAATRALQRFVSGEKKNGRGRLVRPEYSISSITNEQSFDNALPNFERWSIYSNEGKAPQLIARSK